MFPFRIDLKFQRQILDILLEDKSKHLELSIFHCPDNLPKPRRQLDLLSARKNFIAGRQNRHRGNTETFSVGLSADEVFQPAPNARGTIE